VSTLRHLTVAAALVLSCASAASAQVIGTFSWQSQPYCNVLTMTIVQQGSVYLLTGQDTLCGNGAAPITGTAVASGSNVVMGLTVSLPSGRAEHLSATVAVNTASGTWADADGHTGPFAINGSISGSPRPAPSTAALITTAQLSPTVFAGTGAAATVAHSDHNHNASYPGRQVQLLVNGLGMQILGGGTTGTINGCATSASRAANGVLPLNLPAGATVTSVVARVYDGISSSYQLYLRLGTVAATSLDYVTVASASGGGLTIATVAHTLSPASPIVMGTGQTLDILFYTGAALENGLCSAEVNYTLPPAS